jgi:acetolactate synthase I/II/III large subunit
VDKVRCSTAIVQALEAAGVDIVFGYNGHGNWALLDSFEYESTIKGVICRTEDQAIHLADGYFRCRPKQAIPIVSTSVGPGNMNIAGALANAFFESSAMLVLAGGGPTHWLDRGGIEEFYRYGPDEWIQTVKTYTKKALMVTRPDTAVDMILRAYKEATSGRPGPVVVQIPFDIQHSDTFAIDLQTVARLTSVKGPGPDRGAISEAVALISEAKRPLLFIGNGAHNADAFDEIRALVDDFGIPVATTTMAKGVYPENLPLSVGVIGRSGIKSANTAARNCDLLIAVGMHFSDIDTGGWSLFNIPGATRLIHIDIDHTEISRVYPTDVGVFADPKSAVAVLVEALHDASISNTHWSQWRETLAGWRTEWRETSAPLTEPTAPLSYGYICKTVSGIINEYYPDASVCVDTGHLLSFSPPFFEARRPNFYHCGFFHRMGWSLPAALGIKFSRPDQPILALIGDGSFMFTSSTLATAHEYGLPIIAVVLNNRTLQIERELMQRKYGRHAFVDYIDQQTGEAWGPDYCKIAQGLGADAMKISKPEELGPALIKALQSPNSTVLDVEIDDKTPGYRDVWYPYPDNFWKSREEISAER